jgi:hypothetical protein
VGVEWNPFDSLLSSHVIRSVCLKQGSTTLTCPRAFSKCWFDTTLVRIESDLKLCKNHTQHINPSALLAEHRPLNCGNTRQHVCSWEVKAGRRSFNDRTVNCTQAENIYIISHQLSVVYLPRGLGQGQTSTVSINYFTLNLVMNIAALSSLISYKISNQ